MNQLYLDAFSSENDLLGTQLVSVGIDADGKIQPTGSISVHIERSGLFAYVRVRTESGRHLGTLRHEAKPVVLEKGSTLHLPVKDFLLKIVPEHEP